MARRAGHGRRCVVRRRCCCASNIFMRGYLPSLWLRRHRYSSKLLAIVLKARYERCSSWRRVTESLSAHVGVRAANADLMSMLEPGDEHCERIGPGLDGLYHDVHTISDLHRAFGGTCGSSTWCASTALTTWLCEDPARLREYVVGQSILEVGSGIGFTGISLVALGARRLLLTDLSTQLPLMRVNLDTNRAILDGRWVGSCAFEWGARPPRIFKPGLVVACDVIYDEESVAQLAKSFAVLLQGRTSRSRTSSHRPESRRRSGLSRRARHAKQASGTQRASPRMERVPRGTRALLSLPDRVDFCYTRHGDPEVLPDYQLFLDTLDRMMRGWLHVEELEVIPSAKAGTLSTRIVVMLLRRRAEHEPGCNE